MLPLVLLLVACGGTDAPTTMVPRGPNEAIQALEMADLSQIDLPFEAYVTTHVALSPEPVPLDLDDAEVEQMIWRGEQVLATKQIDAWFEVEVTQALKGWVPAGSLRALTSTVASSGDADPVKVKAITILADKELYDLPKGKKTENQAYAGSILFGYRDQDGYLEVESAEGGFGWLPLLHTSRDPGDIDLAISMARARTLKERAMVSEVYALVDATPTNLHRRRLYKLLKTVAGPLEIPPTMTPEQALASNFLETPLLRYVTSSEPAPLFMRPDVKGPRAAAIEPGMLVSSGRRGPEAMRNAAATELVFVDSPSGHGWTFTPDLTELPVPFHAELREQMGPRVEGCAGSVQSLPAGSEVLVQDHDGAMLLIDVPCLPKEPGSPVFMYRGVINGVGVRYLGAHSPVCDAAFQTLPEAVQPALQAAWPKDPFSCRSVRVLETHGMFPGDPPTWRITREAGWPDDERLTGLVVAEAHVRTPRPERLIPLVTTDEYVLAQREYLTSSGEGQLEVVRLSLSPTPTVTQVFLRAWSAAVDAVKWNVDPTGLVTSTDGQRCTFDETAAEYACGS